MIEDEKKLAVSLMEVTKRLNIPFEMVVYAEGGFQFIKTFEQEAYGRGGTAAAGDTPSAQLKRTTTGFWHVLPKNVPFLLSTFGRLTAFI